MTTDYEEFIESKRLTVEASGFEPADLNEMLFRFSVTLCAGRCGVANPPFSQIAAWAKRRCSSNGRFRSASTLAAMC